MWTLPRNTCGHPIETQSHLSLHPSLRRMRAAAGDHSDRIGSALSSALGSSSLCRERKRMQAFQRRMASSLPAARRRSASPFLAATVTPGGTAEDTGPTAACESPSTRRKHRKSCPPGGSQFAQSLAPMHAARSARRRRDSERWRLRDHREKGHLAGEIGGRGGAVVNAVVGDHSCTASSAPSRVRVRPCPSVHAVLAMWWCRPAEAPATW